MKLTKDKNLNNGIENVLDDLNNKYNVEVGIWYKFVISIKNV